MGSEQNDSTSFSPSEPKLCVNGCGFFGTAANKNFCSKCYHDLRVTEKQAAFEKPLDPKPKASETTTSSLESAVASSSSSSSETAAFTEPQQPPRTRCLSCNKKVGLMGFKCKCGSTFCGDHRYPENHGCEFDFKGEGRDVIGKANPVVKAEKVERI